MMTQSRVTYLGRLSKLILGSQRGENLEFSRFLNPVEVKCQDAQVLPNSVASPRAFRWSHLIFYIFPFFISSIIICPSQSFLDFNLIIISGRNHFPPLLTSDSSPTLLRLCFRSLQYFSLTNFEDIKVPMNKFHICVSFCFLF